MRFEYDDETTSGGGDTARSLMTLAALCFFGWVLWSYMP